MSPFEIVYIISIVVMVDLVNVYFPSDNFLYLALLGAYSYYQVASYEEPFFHHLHNPKKFSGQASLSCHAELPITRSMMMCCKKYQEGS